MAETSHNHHIHVKLNVREEFARLSVIVSTHEPFKDGKIFTDFQKSQSFAKLVACATQENLFYQKNISVT